MKRNIVFLKLISLVMAFFVVLTAMLSMLYIKRYIFYFPGAEVVNAVFGIDSIQNHYGENHELISSPETEMIDDPYLHYGVGIESCDEPFREGSRVIENAEIDTVYINWNYGNINIVETDDTAVSMSTGPGAYSFGYRVSGSSLEIQYSGSDRGNSLNSDAGKNLTVKLPESSGVNSKGGYNITVASSVSDINIRDLAVNDFNVSVKYGDITVNNCKINTMNSEIGEGDLYLNGYVSDINAGINSFGNIDCKFEKAAKNINFKVWVGSVTVRVPKDIPGYLVKVDTGMGNSGLSFQSDFNYDHKGDSLYTYGDESLFVNVKIGDGGEGDVSVLELKN